MSLSQVLTNLESYLRYKQEEGVRAAEVTPEVMGQLRALAPLGTEARAVQQAPSRPGEFVLPGPETPVTAAAALDHPFSSLQEIADVVASCRKCSLHVSRIQAVPGQGASRPEIMFVGEAPGADEDQQGLAFVGRAGQLLTKMITAMGCRREDVFIGNILKCRPPENRTPSPGEMETCLPYLKAQICLLQPKVIVALGATAIQGLLGLSGITRLRGKWLTFEGIDLMPTYHPAYLLRTPSLKRDVWTDLKAVLSRLGRTPPPVKGKSG